MRVALTVLAVVLTTVLLTGCEFCRKKKADVPPAAGATTGSDDAMSGAEAGAAGAGAERNVMPGRASTWDEEYARFVGWYLGATSSRTELPPDDAE